MCAESTHRVKWSQQTPNRVSAGLLTFAVFPTSKVCDDRRMPKPRLQIYLEQPALDRLNKAAAASYLSVTDWAASVLQREADRVLSDGEQTPTVAELTAAILKAIREQGK